MTHAPKNPVVVAQVLALVTRELHRASSRSDLKDRLANLGFGYKETPNGRIITTVPHGIEIAAFPLG